MQRVEIHKKRLHAILWAGLGALLFWAHRLLWQAGVLLLLGTLISLLALPVMKRLEKRFSPGVAASLSMACLSAALLGGLVVLMPFLVQQGKQLAALTPSLISAAGEWMEKGRTWLAQSGLAVDDGVQSALLMRGQELLGAMAPALVNWLSQMAGSIGQWMLASAFAYYFLRDRRRIAQWLLLLLPVHARGPAVRMLREMRRETAGYLRGQLLVSAVVGGLSAVGLLLCGVPAWLLLGVLMGVLELIPYVGPVLGGVLVALFALPQGLGRVGWALGVIVAVQQAEGSLLSPQLLSGATRLHPVAVILCVALGGTAAGIAGILLSVPLLLCARAALRVAAQSMPHKV